MKKPTLTFNSEFTPWKKTWDWKTDPASLLGFGKLSPLALRMEPYQSLTTGLRRQGVSSWGSKIKKHQHSTTNAPWIEKYGFVIILWINSHIWMKLVYIPYSISYLFKMYCSFNHKVFLCVRIFGHVDRQRRAHTNTCILLWIYPRPSNSGKWTFILQGFHFLLKPFTYVKTRNTICGFSRMGVGWGGVGVIWCENFPNELQHTCPP